MKFSSWVKKKKLVFFSRLHIPNVLHIYCMQLYKKFNIPPF